MVDITMYKTVIVGGGISGLYLAYKTGDSDTLLIERYDYLGGRIYTEKKDGLVYEGGAGRIGNDHELVLELIKELGLGNKLMPIGKNKLYNLDNRWLKTDKELMEHYRVIRFKSLKDIWAFILYSKKQFKKEQLLSINFLAYLYMILDENEINCIRDSFGYITEITDNNAFVALDTILNSFDIENEEFYVLAGGLSQIVDRMVKKIKNMGVEIRLNCNLTEIERVKKNYYCTLKEDNKEMIVTTQNLVLAMPIEQINKLGYFCNDQYIKSIVVPKPLMRIYARYPLDKNGQVWFNQMPKIVTDTPIQMIIPIDYSKGLIMISYSDNYMAEYWNSLYKDSPDVMEKTIENFLKKIFRGIEIPKANWMTVHHWKYGSHVWSLGWNSELFKKKIFNKYANKNLYITCDCFNNKQAWIEGALEQSINVLELLI